MPPRPSSPRKDRPGRADGEATRAGILEAAGRAFAERGFRDTTSKSICERARTNMAAVNYHFGGREGLYRAVLKEVHQRLVSMDFLTQLAESGLPPEEKLRRFLHALVTSTVDADNWPTRVWAREVLSPSPVLSDILCEESHPKFGMLSRIVAELAGMALDDPRLTVCVLGVAAPCLLMLVVDRKLDTPLQPLFRQSPETLVEQLLAFALAGIRGAVGQAGARRQSRPARDQ